MDVAERNDWVRLYFAMGLKYKDILTALAQFNGAVLSLRHLKRILKCLRLSRRHQYSEVGQVIDFIEKQLEGSGKLHGYRWMFERCKSEGLRCKQNEVRLVLSLLDPEGCLQRRKRRLSRRVYVSRGPNYIWHIDSYDKLKRFGLCINGCIDGFSRNVIWVCCYTTSSNPRVIAGYYTEAIKSCGGCPRLIRSDKGTENVLVREMQQFLRRDGQDDRAGDRSFITGKSTSNQRIEYWWNFLRRECTDFWISMFYSLESDGDFSGDFIDMSLIQFCFMSLLQVHFIYSL